jgi:putative membrane protein
LWGTVVHRPYVYGFLLFYLGFSRYHQGWKRTGSYLVLAYLIALVSELASTRWGFPFGIYTYIETMRTQELWISNVPFWDSLSFVFLSYFAWVIAAAIIGTFSSLRTFLLSGILMMLLDVVIDPLTLLGDRWFLGQIYYYPHGGTYFGVTLSNFAGWCFVGAFTPWLYSWIFGQVGFGMPARKPSSVFFLGVFGIYAGVFLFNLGITAWIGEWKLLYASLAVSITTLTAIGWCFSKRKFADVTA